MKRWDDSAAQPMSHAPRERVSRPIEMHPRKGDIQDRTSTFLQQLDNVFGVWDENPIFSIGPDVTLETVKATRVRLDTCAMDVQATNRTLTKQIDDRDDCAKLANQYVVRARKAIQGYFGPDSTQYA
jgi:hypothetical protein